MSDGRVLEAEEKERFAHELALGYFTNEELRLVFGLQPAAFKKYMESEEILVLRLKAQREIDESDQALRIHARKAARAVIKDLIKVAGDAEAPAKTRMEAGRQLREFAVVADKKALDEMDREGNMLVLKTNLDVDKPMEGGVYSITANEIAEQAEENAGYAEFADILGVTT